MHALAAIEYPQVIEALAVLCDTVSGRALVDELQPSFDEGEVWTEIEKTAEALDLIDRASVSLVGLADIETHVARTSKEGSVDAAGLWLIGTSMRVLRTARSSVDGIRDDHPRLWRLVGRFVEAPTVEKAILENLDADGTVHDDASPGLKDARRKIGVLTKRITDKMHNYVTGKYRDYLSDAVVTQRSGRYVVPLRADHKGKIKGIVHDTSASGQTVFIEPEDVVHIGNELREAEASEKDEVQKVLDALSARVGAIANNLLDSLDAAQEFDALLAKARFAAANRACVPVKRKPGFLKVKTARHPLIPRDAVVPLDFSIGDENQCVLITGPNTGGKTVAIKAIGLAVAMSQSGILPFAEKMELGVFSQLWADIGDEQSLQQSLSTFSGHVKNIAQAMKGLQAGALVLLDEVGAGTDPAEGAGLARAILLTMQAKGARVIASTHYGELKVFASNAKGFVNASMEFDMKSLRPTYQFQYGVPGSSHAFKIALNHGIPPQVIELAKEGASEHESDVAKMIESLERSQKLAQRAQSEADRLAARVRELEQRAEVKIAKAEAARSKAREEAAESLEETIKDIKKEAEEILSSLNRASSQKEIDDAREMIKGLISTGSAEAKKHRPRQEKPKKSPANVKKGDTVRILGHTQDGTVMDEPKDGKAIVQLGSIKMSVQLSDIELVRPPKPAPAKARSANIRLNKGLGAQSEIHLRRLRAEDAAEALERFVDEAVLAGLPSVRIVHGKGEGVLRKISQEFLRRHPHVKRVHDAPPEQGGQGVTIAEFE